MTSEPKPLDVLLFDSGCSEDFVEYAMNHESGYTGDVRKFIDFVEHLRQNDSENQLHATGDSKALMDSGSKKAEHDYTGDNLTSGGYDHVDQNRRW